eukprot:9820216-Alexandrium_andersonii.AAC.1
MHARCRGKPTLGRKDTRALGHLDTRTHAQILVHKEEHSTQSHCRMSGRAMAGAGAGGVAGR